MRGFVWSSVLHACAIGGLFVASGIEFAADTTPPQGSVEVVLLPPNVPPPMPQIDPPALGLSEPEPAHEMVDLRTPSTESFAIDRPLRATIAPPPPPRRVPPERWREAAVIPAVPGHNPPPEYPASARRRGLEGRVEIDVTVSPAGEPTSVWIRDSSGHRVLDEAAASAVWSWRFTPATRDGRPIETTLTVPFRFNLE